MSWSCLNLHPNLPDHPKLVQLESKVGPTALAHLVKLWCWAYKYAPTGDITKFKNPEYLERTVMAWHGEANVLFKALLKIGWIEKKGDGTLEIHDFTEMNEHVIRLRELQSAKAKRRWAGRKESQEPVGQNSQVVETQDDKNMPRHRYDRCPSPSPPSSPSNPTRPKEISPPTPPGGDGGEVSLKSVFEKHTATFGSYPSPSQQSEYQLRLEEYGAAASAWNPAFRKAAVAGAKTPEYVFRVLQSGSRREKIQGFIHGIGKGID